jgi:arylsulfatase A-like enzyme
MKRRDFLKKTGLAGLGFAALGFSSLNLKKADGKPIAPKPNILYVFSDMQRATSLGCYGDPNVNTPNLDAFSKQGARFDAAMSNTPVCCPHRAILMTGLYSHNNGVVSNGVNFTRKARGIAEQFADAGYVTGYSGKWHIPEGYGTKATMPLGFPRDLETRKFGKRTHGHYVSVKVQEENGTNAQKEFYRPTLIADEAIKFIETESKGTKPWIFFASWIPPHGPYASPPKFLKNYQGKLKLPPNVPKGLAEVHARNSLPDYYGMVESLDIEFKRILDALDRVGVTKDTIVIYSSDHGDMVGCQGYKAKRWPYEESARVPFLIRYPRSIKPGQVIPDPFGTADVYPTLATLAGLTPPKDIDGLDYSPMITGKSNKPPRDYAFLQMIYGYVPWPGWRGFRTKKYSYARTVDSPWILYDLQKDPYQMNNLVDDPKSKALVKKMDARLARIMKENGDYWEYKATTGDLKNWVPGGSKQRGQFLEKTWPGCDVTEPRSKTIDRRK